MTGFRTIIAETGGTIDPVQETILAVSEPVTMDSPDGYCHIRADVHADFSETAPLGGPTGIILRIFDGPDATGTVLAEWAQEAPFRQQGAGVIQSFLGGGSWPIAAVMPAGADTVHQHCVTAILENGVLRHPVPYDCVLEVSTMPEGF